MIRLFLTNLRYRFRAWRARRVFDYMSYNWIKRMSQDSHHDDKGGGDRRW